MYAIVFGTQVNCNAIQHYCHVCYFDTAINEVETIRKSDNPLLEVGVDLYKGLMFWHLS